MEAQPISPSDTNLGWKNADNEKPITLNSRIFLVRSYGLNE